MGLMSSLPPPRDPAAATTTTITEVPEGGFLSMLERQAQARADAQARAEQQRREQAERDAARERDPAACTLAPLPLDLGALPYELVTDARATYASERLKRILADAESVTYSRVRVACTAIEHVGKQLVLEHRGPRDDYASRNEISGRCLAGCDAAAIARGLEHAIHERERAACEVVIEARRQALAAEHAEMALNVSLERLRAGKQGPVRWIADKLICDDALTLLVGESGDGKTFCAMAIAICVAAGIPLLGRSVTRSKVLLVLLEGAEADWTRRLEQLAHGLGTTFEALEGHLDVYDAPLCTDDPDSYARLAKYADECGYGLIVIDNLTEIRQGAAMNAENSADAMGNAMRPLTQLAHNMHLAVLLLHHAGSSGNLRGSTAIRQMCDEELRITKAGDRNDAPITVTGGKSRCGLLLANGPLRYRLIDVNDRAGERVSIVPELVTGRERDASTPTIAAPDSDLTPRRELILEIVRAAPGIGVNAVSREIKARTGKTPSMRDVSGDLKWLADDGLLCIDDAKKYRPADGE